MSSQGTDGIQSYGMRASKEERYIEKKKVWRRREDSLQGILDRESVLEPWTVGPSEDRGPLKQGIRVSGAKDESQSGPKIQSWGNEDQPAKAAEGEENQPSESCVPKQRVHQLMCCWSVKEDHYIGRLCSCSPRFPPQWRLLPHPGKTGFGEGGSTVTCWRSVLECEGVHRSQAWRGQLTRWTVQLSRLGRKGTAVGAWRLVGT